MEGTPSPKAYVKMKSMILEEKRSGSHSNKFFSVNKDDLTVGWRQPLCDTNDLIQRIEPFLVQNRK